MNPGPAHPRLARALAITDWLEVSPPPKPYLHVVRRSFATGLHVLILTRETDGALHVVTAVDHGTPRVTCTHEGSASHPDALVLLLEKTAAKWTENTQPTALPAGRPRKRYFYAKPGGDISEPVSRDHLFRLLAEGVIQAHAQVWEDPKACPAAAAGATY
jgi:hypothetical protein